MRVPSYNEQMRYDVRQKGGRLNNGGMDYSGQIAFDSKRQIGRDLSGLADKLMQASDGVFNTNMRINDADATRALTQYQKEFLAKQTEIQQLKGEQALNASAEFETWQQQRTQELTKDLNPVARGMFNQKAGVTFESNRQWVTNYQQGQQKVYEDSVYQANIDTLKDTYLQNINDPKVMQECIDQMFDAKHQYYEKNGLSQEAAKIDYKNEREKWATAGIGLHIDNGQLGKARALLQHSSVYLSPDTQAQLKKKISNEQERLNAKWKKQVVSQEGEKLFQAMQSGDYDAVQELYNNKNIPFEQKEKIVTYATSAQNKANKIKEIEREAQYKKSIQDTDTLFTDPATTDDERIAHIDTLPKGSPEREYAELANFKIENGITPTGKEEEFIQIAEGNGFAKGKTKTELREIYKAVNVELDQLGITSPVKRYQAMVDATKSVEIEVPYWRNKTMTKRELRKEMENNSKYAAYHLVIPDETREAIINEIKKAEPNAEYWSEEQLERKVQETYRMKESL